MSNIQFNYDFDDNTKTTKYGDDQKFEAWSDVNIFNPIANYLIDPLNCMGLNPNMITILSTFFTLLSIYYLHIENRFLSILSYIIGYTLDCVDGRMARKLSMGSDIGMALDCSSDSISNLALFSYIIATRPLNNTTVTTLLLLFGMSFMLALSYGINEAILSKKETDNDNFYERRLKQLESKKDTFESILFDIFLFIIKSSYQIYRIVFPIYDEEKLFKWLNILKHFGPGNYCLLVGILLFYI